MPHARLLGVCLALPLILSACGATPNAPGLQAPKSGRVVRSQAALPMPQAPSPELEQALRQRPDYVRLRDYTTWAGYSRPTLLYFCASYFAKEGVVYVAGRLDRATQPAGIEVTHVSKGGAWPAPLYGCD